MNEQLFLVYNQIIENYQDSVNELLMFKNRSCVENIWSNLAWALVRQKSAVLHLFA